MGWIMLAIVACFWVLGFFKYKRLVGEINDEIDKITKFWNRLSNFAVEFFNNGGVLRNADEYIWLTKKSAIIQESLGQFGVGFFIAPFRAYTVENYRAIINTIKLFRNNAPELRSNLGECHDMVLRYIGALEEEKNVLSNEEKNPLKCIRMGAKVIINFPFFILENLGLLPQKSYQSIANSLILRFFSALLALFSLIATVVGFVVDWDDFLKKIRDLFGITSF